MLSQTGVRVETAPQRSHDAGVLIKHEIKPDVVSDVVVMKVSSKM
jgi:hypothetical protein